MSIDRRQHERKSVRMTVSFSPLDGSLPQSAQSLDISISGMALMCGKRLSLGTRCKINFTLILHGTPEPFTTEAEIMHSTFLGEDGFKIGIRFSNLTPEQSEKIMAFVNRI